jgi:DNA polymerase-3 subunit alpha (Gram-positive type)
MENTRIVILDFETSGLNPYHDDIIEIGAKVYDNPETYSTLVIPKSLNPISEKIRSITNITNQMLKHQGKQWDTACKEFMEWLQNIFKENTVNILVSHNGETFDFLYFRMMLKQMKEELNVSFDRKIVYVDTMLLTRRLLPNRFTYSQQSLCKSYGITNHLEHRAMGDVIALEEIFKRCIESLFKKDSTMHLVNLEAYCKLL